MHNLALALQQAGHKVTGSDDEIYNPARDRLSARGLLPAKEGWDEARITRELEAVIVGMHARKDNPELRKAQALSLPIYSFPSFFSERTKDKTRIVVAGSHGKTTTTSMIMHVLRETGLEFDYLVGAQLQGFETMVRLSDAPLAVIEGDEYLSSPLDPRPKFLHYRPQIAVLTGIAWDHINVFPTFEKYLQAFRDFLQSLPQGARVFYYGQDPHLNRLAEEYSGLNAIPYDVFPHKIHQGQTRLQSADGSSYPTPLMGAHNMQNLMAARSVTQELGVSEEAFLQAMGSFRGAAKRLQGLGRRADGSRLFLDFAHAPSKVKATVEAVRQQFPDLPLRVCLELHTYSSLNRDFLPQYAGSLDPAEQACVYFSPQTLKIKRLKPISREDIQKAFQHSSLQVVTNKVELEKWLNQSAALSGNLLLMSSGRLGGLDIQSFTERHFPKK